ncbi:radical SAM protein [Thermococcus aggregans]|uniref:Radical SAM protein n=1 Tax=Thermococcus aggregans TaxID=110163 RepID=A0A9E7MVW0_THEAG|nr:radical SAM protein [Thermococcus aggregans]USS39898.1 radical SAM protein [Thermococcus aggregans]
MNLSFFVNITKLNDHEYLLLKPNSRPLIVDKEVVRTIRNLNNAPREVVEILTKEGFITNLKPEEEIALFYSFLEQNEPQIRGKYSIAITYNCNFACTYCYERGINKESTISRDMIDKFYEISTNDRDKIKNNIGITGGEPLMYENAEILEYFLREGKRRGFTFDVITNGYELTEFLDMLKKNNVKIVKVTLDGPKEIHDKRRIHRKDRETYDKILDGIKEAQDRGIKVTIFVNVDSQNINYIPQLVNELKENEIDAPILLKRVNERSGVRYPLALSPKEYFERMFKIIKEHRLKDVLIYEFDVFYANLLNALSLGTPIPARLRYCGGASPSVLIFDPRGDIYSCDYVLGDKRFSVGTYYPEFKLNVNYYLWKNRTASKIKECFNCKLSLLCSGGCPMEAYRTHGTLYKPYCEETKYLFEYIKLWLSLRRDQND